MTSPAELETWLHEVFPDATIEVVPVHRLMRPTLGEEVHEYQLFRIAQQDAPLLQVGVTTKALERLSPAQVQSGLRRAIASATRDGKTRGDLRFLLTASEVIVCEGRRGKR